MRAMSEGDIREGLTAYRKGEQVPVSDGRTVPNSSRWLSRKSPVPGGGAGQRYSSGELWRAREDWRNFRWEAFHKSVFAKVRTTFGCYTSPSFRP
jgi:hypothetical protein